MIDLVHDADESIFELEVRDWSGQGDRVEVPELWGDVSAAAEDVLFSAVEGRDRDAASEDGHFLEEL